MRTYDELQRSQAGTTQSSKNERAHLLLVYNARRAHALDMRTEREERFHFFFGDIVWHNDRCVDLMSSTIRC